MDIKDKLESLNNYCPIRTPTKGTGIGKTGMENLLTLEEKGKK